MRYKFFGVVVALTFLLVSCSKNDNKKSDISSDKPKVSDTKNISTENEYTTVDLFENIKLLEYNNGNPLYPFGCIYVSFEDSQYAEMVRTGVDVPWIGNWSYDNKKVTINLKVQDYCDRIKNYLEENKLEAESNTKEIVLDVSEFQSLLISEDMYTSEVDEEITKYIKENDNVDILSTYLIVMPNELLNGQGSTEAALTSPLSVMGCMGADNTFFLERNTIPELSEYKNQYGAYYICYDNNQGKYCIKNAVMKFVDGKLTDKVIENVSQIYGGYYASEEECKNYINEQLSKLSNRGQLIEYIK